MPSPLKGRKRSPESVEKGRLKQLGKIPSPEARAKMSAAKTGYVPWNVGIPCSEEAKAKMRSKLIGVPGKYRGARHWNYKGGVTPELRQLRATMEYRIWRTAVFKRDEYTCVNCGVKNAQGVGRTIKLQADHIKPFAQFPELRFDVGNGQTLCEPCHRKTDTYGGFSRRKVVSHAGAVK